MDKRLFVTLIASILVGMQLAVAGCSSGHGWKVEFGIVPINQVADTQQLVSNGKKERK